MQELRQLTATQLRRLLKKGDVSPKEAAIAAITAIQKEDQALQAWSEVNSVESIEGPFGAAENTIAFPLFGIPFGIKDIFDTRDLKTEYGSPIYRGNRPTADAASVSRIRETGGVVVGKTATTEFAMLHPCATRNPHNPKHTPGGSSSGSAASVAACMVPLATGTQTGGSIIRPAAYCGVYAIKPTFGIVSRIGVKTVSENLDTVGFFSRSVEDLALVLGATTRNLSMAQSALGEARPETTKIRLAFCRSPHWDAASDEMKALFLSVEDYVRKREPAPAVDLPNGLDEAVELIIQFEAMDNLSNERIRNLDKCSSHALQTFSAGQKRTFEGYVDAMRTAERARIQMDKTLSEIDCLITLSAPGEAPAGLDNTGPATFNKIWTLLHTPCINVPAGRSSTGLPLGLQVVAARYRDDLALGGAKKLRVLLQDAGFTSH
jgi:amidase